jgi:hypothetical protein
LIFQRDVNSYYHVWSSSKLSIDGDRKNKGDTREELNNPSKHLTFQQVNIEGEIASHRGPISPSSQGKWALNPVNCPKKDP